MPTKIKTLKLSEQKKMEKVERKERKRRRLCQQKNRTIPVVPNPVNVSMASRFKQVIDAHRTKTPVHLGVSSPGTLRPLTSSFENPSPSSLEGFFHRLYWSHDRSLSEWFAFLKHWKDQEPAFRMLGMTAPDFEPLFYKEQRMRWLARKWIRRVRLRCLNRHLADDSDLFTTLPIPAESCVTVYDYKTRSCYKFHTNTMVKMILNNLTYASYAIADPQQPKNPYNNLPWTLAQAISIAQQLSRNLSLMNRFVPTYITRWVLCGCDAKVFAKTWNRSLQIDAAVKLFEKPERGEGYVLFCEVVEDLYSDHAELGALIVKRHIIRRSLPDDLMKEWDTFVMSQWIWENHHILYGKWKTTEDLDSQFMNLHRQTSTWIRTAPRTVLQRPGTSSITPAPDPPLPSLPSPVVAPVPIPAAAPVLVASTATTVVPVTQDTLLPLLLLFSSVRLD